MHDRRPGTVAGIAAAIAAGEMAPSDAVSSAIDRLRADDQIFQVVAHPLYETAMDQAREADQAVADGDTLGPLHGVPIGVKDLYDIAGQPTAAGSTILADSVADTTATAVARLEAAGAIVVAKLAMTEFAGGAHNPALPTPVNPYDHTLSPAGSSSGSAVAVAAGLLPAALGSDTVASIRFPAAWTGCVGFKPSYGRISRHGVFPLAATYDHCGPLTSTVADADLIARAMAGPDPLDITTRFDPYGDRIHGVDGMRIGWDETFVTEHAGPDVGAASRAAVAALADAGAEVVDVVVPLRVEASVPYGQLFRAEVAAVHHDLWPAHRDDYTPGFASAIKAAGGVSRDDVVRAHEFRIGFRHAIDHLFTDVDALVTPTAPVNALPEIPLDENFISWLTFTWLWNLCGAPAISIPWGLDTEALPHSVQLIAAPGDDPTAIAAATVAEAAAPDLPPPPR